jgi:hypothetical protein
MLAGANNKPNQGLLASAMGIVVLLFTAIGIVAQLKGAFNTVWEVDERQISGVWQFIRTYLISLAAVIGLGFLLLISLLFTASLSAAGQYFGGQVAAGDAADRRFVNIFRGHHRDIRHDVQVAAGYSCRMARRLVRRRDYRGVVRTRQAIDRHLCRPARACFKLRCGRFARHSVDLGLLLFSDLAVRRRTHALLCEPLSRGLMSWPPDDAQRNPGQSPTGK